MQIIIYTKRGSVGRCRIELSSHRVLGLDGRGLCTTTGGNSSGKTWKNVVCHHVRNISQSDSSGRLGQILVALLQVPGKGVKQLLGASGVLDLTLLLQFSDVVAAIHQAAEVDAMLEAEDMP